MGWEQLAFDLEDTPSPPGASGSSSPDSSTRATGSSATSATTWLDAADMNIYGPGGIGAGDQRLVTCNDCSKPILEGALADHRLTCKRARELNTSKQKTANGSANGVAEGKKRAASDSGDDSTAKKAKAGDDKMKKKPSISVKPPNAAKVPRNKGPVDVNTQCGVIIGDGKPCARSLTCKSHSMAQKREVPGRSAPFKVLLAEWQIRNTNSDAKTKQQATQVLKEHSSTKEKMMAAAMAANGRPMTEATAAPAKKPKARQMYYGEASDSGDSMDEGVMGDSEDEVEQVFAGLTAAKAGCRTLAQPTFGGSYCVRAIRTGRFRDALFTNSGVV